MVEKTYRDILTRDGVVSVELIKNRLQGIATNPTTLLTMSKVIYKRQLNIVLKVDSNQVMMI